MAELTTLARPYAKAAFSYAKEHKELVNWSEMLKFLATLSKNFTIRELFASPSLTSKEKAKKIINVCENNLTESFDNFIHVLAKNERLVLLPEIFELFCLYKSEQEKIIDVTVTSAYALNNEQIHTLVSALSQRLNQEVRLHPQEDSSLIGGVIIRAGDLVIDGSVRGKIAKLTETLKF
ncbi:UNVERIFIED_CONTAM: hypothetical protein GTU68_008229 [Idotea baltica]|nr:hypothetical protein [Idotea baltica]